MLARVRLTRDLDCPSALHASICLSVLSTRLRTNPALDHLQFHYVHVKGLASVIIENSCSGTP
ncbi:hypothetical protein [Bradyrhizobium elkanii]|jgi:hypothetical protein|uniref:hypothetical protein n=1 Tax=Bradyrhizobium elkanii TaxID=29448 RepID=UPI0003117555|nr:hypothetical protein [Bradyrhizobium elkanii]